MVEKLNMQEIIAAPSTQKVRNCHIALFDAWRGDREETDETIAQYLSYLFDKGKSPGKANGVLSAIRWRAISEDRPDPRGKLCRIASANYRIQGRKRGRGQVDPITWEMVEQLCAIALGERTRYGYRDAAMFYVMSDGWLRPSEASAIEVCHLDFETRLLHIPRSKTDQEGIGAEQYMKKRTIPHVLRWMEKAKITDGHLFRPIHTRGHVMKGPLCVATIRRIVKARCKQAGFKGRFGGHSFRVGTAVTTASRGATDMEMMLAGRWKGSGMTTHYAQKAAALQSVVARLEDDDAA